MQVQEARFQQIVPLQSVRVSDIGKILMVIGASLLALGAIIWLAGKGGVPLGRLPGDIEINRPGFKVYFPLMTCLLISVVLTVILWFLRKR